MGFSYYAHLIGVFVAVVVAVAAVVVAAFVTALPFFATLLLLPQFVVLAVYKCALN